MHSLRRWILGLLIVLLAGLLMGSDIECDMEDGELEVDFDHGDRHGHYYDDEYYEDFVYVYTPEPCFWCY